MDKDQILNNQQNKVLIVEDEIDLRVLYAEVLRDAGYTVEEAPDGEIGLQKVLNFPWDILLLDIMLPGKDGLRVLKEMGLNSKRGPIIMLTNLNSEHIIQEAFKMGADGYLIKSEITPDKIINEVESFLSKPTRSTPGTDGESEQTEQTPSII